MKHSSQNRSETFILFIFLHIIPPLFFQLYLKKQFCLQDENTFGNLAKVFLNLFISTCHNKSACSLLGRCTIPMIPKGGGIAFMGALENCRGGGGGDELRRTSRDLFIK